MRLPPAALGRKNGGALFSAEREPLHLLHAGDDLLDLATCRHLPAPEEAQHRWQINRVNPVALAIPHGAPVVGQEGEMALLTKRDGLAFTRIEFPRQRYGQRLVRLGQSQNRYLPCGDRRDQRFKIAPAAHDRDLDLVANGWRDTERGACKKLLQADECVCSGKRAEHVRIADDRHRMPCCSNRSARSSISSAERTSPGRCMAPRACSASRISQRVTPANSAARPKLHASAR